MSARVFAVVVGGIMVLIGVLALALPVSAANGPVEVNCGSGFSGVDPNVALGAADSGLAGECADAVSARRWRGYPIGGIGLVAFVGGLLIRTPTVRGPRRVRGASATRPRADGPA